MAILRKANLSFPLQMPLLENEDLSSREVLRRARDLKIRMTPLDIEAVAKSYNLCIVREAMSDELSGFLENRSGQWVIGINALHHPRRQRFSIAHELAHFLLHKSKQEGFRDNSFLRYKEEAQNPIEAAADKFAGELLMPETEFRALVTKGVTAVEDLANHFDASSMAIRYRAKQLGFLRSGI